MEFLETPPRQPGETHLPSTSGQSTLQSDWEFLEAVRLAGRWTDVTDQTDFSTIPTWSAQGWDESQDIMYNGRIHMKRVLADRERRLRPAIRQEDDATNPTEYARLFGVDPALWRPGDNLGHSGLTPTAFWLQSSQQSPEDDELNKSLQRRHFSLFDTLELAIQQAMDPRLQFSWPPDLNQPLHSFFARHRFTQAPLRRPGPKAWTGEFNIQYGPELDGIGGTYDAQTNDKVWNAIQPALQLASRIVTSQHPYWQAMTSVFHLRPVDPSKDGRPPEQLEREGSVPYASIWTNTNATIDPRVPEPYPGLQTLQDLGFDSNASRALCMSLLDQLLQLSIQNFTSEGSFVNDEGPDFWFPRISVNAELVWPLLAPRYIPDSVKAAYTFALAASFLHELGHACAATLRIILTRPDILAQNQLGHSLSWDVVNNLMKLGDRILGVRQFVDMGYQVRPARFYQFFFGDEVQGEEGLNFEKMLWGSPISSLPVRRDGFSSLAPLITTSLWPGVNPQPFEQGRAGAQLDGTGYDRYLLYPPVQSWHQFTAVPVEWYARMFQDKWWSSEFRRFQHQGLKLSYQPDDLADPSQLVRSSTLDVIQWDNKEMILVLGEDQYAFFMDTMWREVGGKGYPILADYLFMLAREAAEARIVTSRFANDDTAWWYKDQEMTMLANEVASNYQAMTAAINDAVFADGDGAPITQPALTMGDFAARVKGLNDAVRNGLQSMMQLNMLLDQEIAYEQDMISILSQQSEATKQALDSSIATLRDRITRMSDLLTGRVTKLDLTALDPQTIEGGWATTIRALLETYITSGVNFGTVNLPPEAIEATRMFLRLVDDVRFSHNRFLSQAHLLAMNLSPTGPDFGSLASGKRLGATQSLKLAAIRDLRAMPDGPLKQLVARTVEILQALEGPSQLREEAAAAAESEDSRRQRQLAADVFFMLANEAQYRRDRQAARDLGVPNVEADPLVEVLVARILDKAGDNVADREWLAGGYDEGVVAMILLANNG